MLCCIQKFELTKCDCVLNVTFVTQRVDKQSALQSADQSETLCHRRELESNVGISFLIKGTRLNVPLDARQAHNTTSTQGLSSEIIAKRTKRHLDELEVR